MGRLKNWPYRIPKPQSISHPNGAKQSQLDRITSLEVDPIPMTVLDLGTAEECCKCEVDGTARLLILKV